jgi:hypothetical protein
VTGPQVRGTSQEKSDALDRIAELVGARVTESVPSPEAAPHTVTMHLYPRHVVAAVALVVAEYDRLKRASS